MNRRAFLQSAALLGVVTQTRAAHERGTERRGRHELLADLAIVGGGLGGCAAALAACRNGLKVILTEETDWIGGQLTSQAVPPDEHQHIETHGCTKSYRALRTAIRNYYKQHYPLTEAARQRDHLNPGDGAVSRLCHEPRVALAVLQSLLAPYLSNGQLTLLLETKPIAAEVDRDTIRSIQVRNLVTGHDQILHAQYFLDATELGDLLPLTKTEYVTGAESQSQTGEPHAAKVASPRNQQAFTMCMAIDYDPAREHIIEKPSEYSFWRNYVPKLNPPWPGKLLDLTYTHPASGQPKTLGFNPTGQTPGAFNLWLYRRLINAKNFAAGTYSGDVSLVNWPQNDYLLGNLVGVSEREQKKHIASATQLSLSLLYWLQTEGGWPGLRLRSDLLGTTTGVAKYPYVRESRRIKSQFTIVEQQVGESFFDSVGIGSYAIDLHPTTAGDNYIDFQTRPFQIPLGALLPVRVRNLIPANKNIGTTHVTNGCYRLHPVEWNIGESAGLLAGQAIKTKTAPAAIRADKQRLADFQSFLTAQGIELAWPT